jgi:Superinfection immunity protein
MNSTIVFLVLAFLYLLPSLVASYRHVRNTGSVYCVNFLVYCVNFLLGWTLVGWAVALAMAARSVDEAGPLVTSCPRCTALQNVPLDQDEFECWQCHYVAQRQSRLGKSRPATARSVNAADPGPFMRWLRSGWPTWEPKPRAAIPPPTQEPTARRPIGGGTPMGDPERTAQAAMAKGAARSARPPVASRANTITAVVFISFSYRLC